MEIALTSILLAIIYYLLRKSNQDDEIEQLRGELMTQQLLVDKLRREHDEMIARNEKSVILYKIVDKNDIEFPSHYSGLGRTEEQAKKILQQLNENGEHRPYKMIPE
jgi:hypothetical protein